MNDNRDSDSHLLYETRSDDAQEIVGKMPVWIVRWGISLSLGIIVILIATTAFIKYPEVVTSNVTFLHSQPTMVIKNNLSGYITNAYINDSVFVRKGKIIATLNKDLDTNLLHRTDSLINQISLLLALKKDMQTFKLDTSQELQGLYKNYNDLIISLNNYKVNNVSNNNNYVLKDLQEHLHNIRVAIYETRKNYFIVSPIDGYINYIVPLNKDVYYEAGTSLAVVTPLNSSDSLIVTGSINSQYSSKIKIGQKVSIAIADFPSDKFGIIQGEVTKVAPICINGKQLFRIKLLSSKFTLGEKLPLNKVNSGAGEIVITNNSLLRHIIGETINL